MPKKHLENFFMIKLLKKLCIENVFQVFPGGPEIKTACTQIRGSSLMEMVF